MLKYSFLTIYELVLYKYKYLMNKVEHTMTKTETRINNLTRKALASEWMPDENHYEPGYLSSRGEDLLINVCLAHKYTCKEFDRLLHTTQIDGRLGYCLVLEYFIRSLDDNSALTNNPKAALVAWLGEVIHMPLNSAFKGKFRVTSCNEGTLDGSQFDYISIVRKVTCPMCGQTWLRTFKYTSGMENADMYPYDTEPYEEQRYLDECCSQKCYDVAQYNTYFYNPDTYKLSDEAAKENTLVDSEDLPF